MSRIGVLFCFLLVSFGAVGQSGDVYGNLSLANGNALVGTAVVVKGLDNISAITDIDGNFTLHSIPYGNHELLVSSIEVSDSSFAVSINKPSTQVSFQLKESITFLNGIEVTAKTVKAEIESSGYAVSVVEAEKIQYQSIQVNDYLDQSAGVRIRQAGGLGSEVRYNINGLSGNSVRVFIDGVPIENYGASYSLSSIPASSIERIEVYKGVVPAHLGGDALGGAINVITKKQGDNTFNLSYSFGSFNTHQVAANGNYRNEKNGLTFRGSMFYNYSDNNYDVWGDKVYLTNEEGKKEYITAERFHDTYQSKGGLAEIGFTDVSWADEFMVGVLLSDMDKDIQNGATMEIVYGNRRAEQATQSVNLNYVKNDLFVKGLSLNFTALYSNLNRTVIDTVPYIYDWSGNRVEDYFDLNPGPWLEHQTGAEAGDPSLNTDHEKKLTGRLNLGYALNENNNLVFNILATDFSREPDDPLLPAAERALIDTRYFRKGVAALSYENRAMNDRLRSSVFGKYYYQYVKLKDPVYGRDDISAYEYEDTRKETGFGAATAFALFPKLELTASAERAIRMPESTEVFGNTAENVDASYELQPERSTNFNLGVILGLFGKKNHKFGVSANVFYRNIQGMIMPGVPDQQDDSFSYVNLNSVLSSGFDAEVKYSFKENLKVNLGVSITNPRFNTQYDEYGAEYAYYKDRLRNEPFFTINNNISYVIRDVLMDKSRMSMYYNMGYVHEFYRNWPSIGGANKDVIPSQMVHDLGLAYTFPKEKLTISADARNIFNEQVFDNWALQKPGRAFYIKITYGIL